MRELILRNIDYLRQEILVLHRTMWKAFVGLLWLAALSLVAATIGNRAELFIVAAAMSVNARRSPFC